MGDIATGNPLSSLLLRGTATAGGDLGKYNIMVSNMGVVKADFKCLHQVKLERYSLSLTQELIYLSLL